MEALFVGVGLALLTWHIAKSYVPSWLPPIALRVVVALMMATSLVALLRCASDEALAVLFATWLLVGGASFAIRRWLARSKEREARRAALHAARMHVRRRAPPPGPSSGGSP